MNNVLIKFWKNLNSNIWYCGKKEVNKIIGNIRIKKIINSCINDNIKLIYNIGIVRINKFVVFVYIVKFFFIVFKVFCEK